MPASVRISTGAAALGLTPQHRILPAEATYTYELIDLFTTQSGTWDAFGRPYDVPDWARAAYLRPVGASDYFDEGGADHHLFARVIDEAGNPIATPIRFWTVDGQNTTISTGEKKSGWCNWPIWSSFNPARDEQGPWQWAPEGARTIVAGGGLPNNLHVSSFAVWQRVPVTDQDDDDIPAEPTQPGQPWYYSVPDIFLLAALALGEAEGEGERGWIAVLNVVCNRVRSPRWSSLFREVILQANQFDGLQRIAHEPIDLPPDLYRLAHLAYNWGLADITDGATHFCRYDAHPYWRPLLTYKGRIGNHVFYRED